MNDQERAALAIRTAADLLSTAAALVELGEKSDALRHMNAVREALEQAATAGDDWAEVARLMDATLAPTLAPGLEMAAQAFVAWEKMQQHSLPAEHYTTSEKMADAEARARAGDRGLN